MIPIQPDIFTKIDHLEMTPLGITEQPTITAEGKIGVKNRSIHDCSFPMQSGHSINAQHVPELLDDCQYGQCLRRLFHSLHRLRQVHPDTPIYICKYDLDAVYRRLHVHPDHTVKATTIVNGIGCLLLRLLPFGAVAVPSAYSLVSEAIFDLANDLIRDKSWDPLTLQSPNSSHLHPPNKTNQNKPFGSAKDLLVYIPLSTAFYDGYIDDLIAMAVDLDDNVHRSQQALPLSAHSVFRLLHINDDPNRKDTLSLRKLSSEGRPDETKTILGWNVDTRAFRISLSEDKYKRWMIDMASLLTKYAKHKAKTIESTIGRLNHVGHIIPMGRYFLNRLRQLHSRCTRYGPQTISNSVRADIKLW